MPPPETDTLIFDGSRGRSVNSSFWLGIAVVGVGLAASLWGYDRLSLYRTIGETPTSEVSDVTESGLVELRGTAKSAGGRTLEAPLSGRAALAAG